MPPRATLPGIFPGSGGLMVEKRQEARPEDANYQWRGSSSGHLHFVAFLPLFTGTLTPLPTAGLGLLFTEISHLAGLEGGNRLGAGTGGS
jgi:hypothetical protein